MNKKKEGKLVFGKVNRIFLTRIPQDRERNESEEKQIFF
jgi:hypothetical protein